MIEVIIHKYRGTKRVLVPETWDELTEDQLVKVARIMHTVKEPVKRDLQLVKAVCGLRRWQLAHIAPEVIHESLFGLIQWLYEDGALIRQLIPTVKIGRTLFYGPDTDLSNLRMVEFHFAERALYEWHQDPENADALFAFISCIYRPAKKDYDIKLNPDGDVRESYNGTLCEGYAKQLKKKMPLALALAISVWYKGCRQQITNKHPRIFGGEGGANDAPSYFLLMRSIAQQGTYGTLGDVEQLHLHTALYEMECALDEAEALKQQSQER